jgi:hypothetical protein
VPVTPGLTPTACSTHPSFKATLPGLPNRIFFCNGVNSTFRPTPPCRCCSAECVCR